MLTTSQLIYFIVAPGATRMNIGGVLFVLSVLLMAITIKCRKSDDPLWRPGTVITTVSFALALVLFFSGLGIYSTSMYGAEEQERAESDDVLLPNVYSEVADTVNTDVSYDDIYYAYEANKLRAEDVYKGNRYQITAEVNGMYTTGLLNLTGGATLTMLKQVDSTSVFFYAQFEKEQEDALKTINVGDTITFNGTCTDHGNWYDCELVL